MSRRAHRNINSSGFTIVELLIVIVVIGILATLTIVGYNGITNRASVSKVQSEALQGYKAVVSYATQNSDQYPADTETAGIPDSSDTLYEYSVNNGSDPKTFCLSVTSSSISYYVSNENSSPTSGLCVGHSGGAGPVAGDYIQTITSANCPSTIMRVVDARDNHTYWVQELADGKCWMLTNLGYAGGGTNTYSDVKTLTNGTGGATSFTTPRYYVVPSTTNYTTEPTEPSIATNGLGQYGYLYNWCGAMGGQTTAACANAATPVPDPNISICPSGWRLPTGNGGEVGALNTAVNSGATNDDSGLRSAWLGQWGGYWNGGGFASQDALGFYWTSTQYSADFPWSFYHDSSYVGNVFNFYKNNGFAVRCLAE